MFDFETNHILSGQKLGSRSAVKLLGVLLSVVCYYDYHKRIGG